MSILVSNLDSLKQLVSTLLDWCRQLQLAINEINLIRRENVEMGPGDELAYWRKRFTILSRWSAGGVLTVLKTREYCFCKAVVLLLVGISDDWIFVAGFESVREILRLQRWQTHFNWRNRTASSFGVDLYAIQCSQSSPVHLVTVSVFHLQTNEISEYETEAKSNVQFLTSLDKYFGSIYKNTPVGLVFSLVIASGQAYRTCSSIDALHQDYLWGLGVLQHSRKYDFPPRKGDESNDDCLQKVHLQCWRCREHLGFVQVRFIDELVAHSPWFQRRTAQTDQIMR